MSASRTGILKNDTLFVFGSRIGMLSVEYSGESNNWPPGFTVGWRRSDEMRSCRYLSGVDHSHSVMTTLRSMPCGRGGSDFGRSPLAIPSVHSPKYLYGTPAHCPARRLVIISPD